MMTKERSNRLFGRCDVHVHTRLSPCGLEEMTPEAVLQAAADHGIEYLGISDHMHPFTDISILDRNRREFGSSFGTMDIYIGCEGEVLSVGRTSISEEVIEKCDYIILAANHFTESYISQPLGSGREEVARHFLDMLMYAVSLEFVDVIAHPLFVMPDTYDPLSPALLTTNDLKPVVDLAAKNRIAIEISRRALAPEQRPCMLGFYRLCRDAGLKFSIGSDAHRLNDVGRIYLVGPLITELGLTDDDIWLPPGKAGRQGKVTSDRCRA
ncbi:MAG: PHP domain-containing protein [Armatimonadetes bacterium]|nr:PHP domain-containing protein [Armatimonadota bacterium]